MNSPIMKKILLFGAGKSATILIDYLVDHAATENWFVTVVDADINLARSKTGNSANARAVSFDINDTVERNLQISEADIVISLLPPALHTIVAKTCIEKNKNLLTASYVDEEIRKMQAEIAGRNLIFFCEMGLDPGIDHMSAMKLIDQIREEGGKVTSFISHCGGLVAPESDDNPWHYKISWNPRNILLAGKSGAHYRQDGEEKRLTYEQLFTADRKVEIPGLGALSWYPNRDSLSYASLYGLEDACTFIRTTLRHPDFMVGWKKVIEMKLTDETPAYETNGKSLSGFFKEHLEKWGFSNWASQKITNAKKGYHASPGDSLVINQLAFLGKNDETSMIQKGYCSAADVMQLALETKLALKPNDKDMIVMLHEIGFENPGKQMLGSEISSSLVVYGENSLRTAMAKTVGLPLGIAAKLILNGTIRQKGLLIPTSKEIYEPVLKELEAHGVRFQEETKQLR
jgi:saccharopine dehydrogenase-like NADP-dependent oxidoreductase